MHFVQSLELNCAAMIFAHNHPSGDVTPSTKDKMLTHKLDDLLSGIDVRVLDHLIIGCGEPFSFLDAGLI